MRRTLLALLSSALLSSALLGSALLAATPGPALGQDRGAAALGELVSGLGVSARVLVVAAHPDDEDTRLIAWLARARHVETAYLSLTRGDGGQNLIGNELGEALGVIRTEELLAARRIDGAHQYFTRAYDFGFSKSAEETFRHWPRDSVLGDVVQVVRAFRPHVIVAIFSGTPRDGHGHHQASGILAREAYDASGDTARFPAREYGPAWTVPKFYHNTSYRGHEGATLRFNAGEYSPLLGRSYAEIAAESRSQHRSQGFGQLQRKGVVMVSVRREATRVNDGTPAEAERGLFDGIDTTIARVRPAFECAAPSARAAFDSLRGAIAAARRAFDAVAPERTVAPLAAVSRLAERASPLCQPPGAPDRLRPVQDDADASLTALRRRVREALLAAAGVALEATVERGLVAIGGVLPVTVSVYNRGRAPVTVPGSKRLRPPSLLSPGDTMSLRPDSVAHFSVMHTAAAGPSAPWWLRVARRGDLFAVPVNATSPEDGPRGVVAGGAGVVVRIAGEQVYAAAPVVYRFAHPVRGEVQVPLAVVPAITVTLDRTLELAPANAPLDRTLGVALRSADTASRDVTVRLRLPSGLTADSAARTVVLPTYGATRTVEFRVRGRVPPGRHAISAVAESRGQTFATGYVPIEYEHIRPQRLYRDAVVQLEAVDVKLPPRLGVAYIPGVGDNVAPALRQLGVPLTVVEPAALPGTDLSRFTTVVVGPRAYDASAELVAHNARLLDYVRNGGTMVVQYGQYEMTQPGMMPYPVTINRPHDRVTDESAPVRVLRPNHPLLNTPNRITDRDWEGWVQERSLYMPRTFAQQYTPLLAMSDPGEEARNGALLVAPYGRGMYVYTTLALFRQLPAGVPGAARLFANLLGARGESADGTGRGAR